MLFERRKLEKTRGFTIAELLVVVAILAVLVAVSIPIFTMQLENARNRTDTYNAKVIADAVQIYYMSNPSELQAFMNYCNIDKTNHCAQIIVKSNSANIPSILVPALRQAGLITPSGSSNFKDIICKSKKNWKAFSIAFTTWREVSPDGNIVVAYRGRPQDDNLSAHAHGWYFVQEDATDFRHMALGNK